MKKLGFGMMRLPRVAGTTEVDFEEFNRMVDLFISRGFTYFDTALMYCGGRSEAALKRAVVDRYPRESFTVTTKLHIDYIKCAEDIPKIFNGQLERTGAGYFDYYLVHGIENGTAPGYEQYDCFNFVLKMKEQGLVRHAGFSFHGTPELLDELLVRHPEMEFVQLQINYLDWESEWVRARRCYEVARAHNKPVIVMEPVKGGTLANVPQEAEKTLHAVNPDMSVPSFAIRFAAGLEGVMMVLSGMSTLAQVDDNTSYMQDFAPLSEEEKAACFKAADIINSQIAIPCTGCSYCTGGCPQSIAIPQYFSLYNEDMRENLDKKGWTVNYSNYNALTVNHGRAHDCVACGQCEGICPQHLPIIELLKKVSDHYDTYSHG